MDVWNQEVHDHTMYKVVKNLRMLKKPIRKLMWSKGNVHDKVIQCRHELDNAQKVLDADPFHVSARDEASRLLKEYNVAIHEEESLLKQKSKIEWLRVGDNNTSYFHKVVNGRMNRNRIESLTDTNGNLIEGATVPIQFVQHYETFLGSEAYCEAMVDVGSLFTKRISQHQADSMVRPITDYEVKKAIFDIGEGKNPGSGWLFLGFLQGSLEYYWWRSHWSSERIFSEWIKASLGEDVSINQSAFLPGRRIADNILLTQELMKNYHLNRGASRSAFKVDIQKAFDTVDWNFLEETYLFRISEEND
ncbi:uncharacterized protein [Rutidosis leptorrhynchoides]|uniref:uncharacterized protein n=1 Tax=Rutidosis leptorrhynchoides TaxID=125765 RepID=UPI003A99141C